MRIVVCTFLALGLFFSAPGFAPASDYCPLSFMGYINGAYCYYCHYCDTTTTPAACQNVGVSVASMYSCGGDWKCCNMTGDTCVDPIPQNAILLNGSDNKKDRGDDKDEATPPAKSNNPSDSTYIPLAIGNEPQKNYLGVSEKFALPGPHIQKKSEFFVKIPEAMVPTSYFRLFKLEYHVTEKVGIEWKDVVVATMYIGMEMDPLNPPTDPHITVVPGSRARKGPYQHTISYNGEDFDASSKRPLP